MYIIYLHIKFNMPNAIFRYYHKSKLTQIFVQQPSFYFTFRKYCTLTKAANFSQSTAVCVISVSAFRYGSHLKSSRVIHINVVPTKVIIMFTPWFVTISHVVKI